MHSVIQQTLRAYCKLVTGYSVVTTNRQEAYLFGFLGSVPSIKEDGQSILKEESIVLRELKEGAIDGRAKNAFLGKCNFTEL